VKELAYCIEEKPKSLYENLHLLLPIAKYGWICQKTYHPAEKMLQKMYGK